MTLEELVIAREEKLEQLKAVKNPMMIIRHLDFHYRNATPDFVVGTIRPILHMDISHGAIRLFYKIHEPDYESGTWWVPNYCAEIFCGDDAPDLRPKKTKHNRSW
jgi:hypothetical protein